MSTGRGYEGTNQHHEVNREMPFKGGGPLVISLNVTKERKGLKYDGEGGKNSRYVNYWGFISLTQYRRAKKEVTSITMSRVRHHSMTEIFACVFQSVHQVQPPKCDCFTQFYSAKVAYKGFYHHWARKAGSCKRHKDISSENFSQKNLQNLTTPRVIYRSFYVKSVKKKNAK